MTDTVDRAASIPAALARAYAPIRRDLDQLEEFLGRGFSDSETLIHELLVHIAQYQGKRIRPACVFLAGKSLGGTGSDHVKCGAIIELIHTATLVHDDLLDDASIRRRVPTVNAQWGERASVLLGDYIYSRGFSLSTEVSGMARMLADTTHDICAGELLQIRTAFDTDLSEERYYEIIRLKTAVLYGMACRVGAVLSGASEEEARALEEFGEAVGMAFQIVDDALDLTGEEREVGKSLGTDLKKGKMTLPLIRLRDSLHGGKLEEFLWVLEHPEGIGTQHRVLRMLEDKDILRSVDETAREFVETAVAALERIPGSPVRESFEALARFIIDRRV